MAISRTGWNDEFVSVDVRMGAADDRVGEIAGVLNSGHGALVDLVADALEADLWAQWGVHSPSHWLSWKSGIAGRHARHVVQVARRRRELPFTVAALREGRLSLDQARVIAAHVPAEYERAAVGMAVEMTIGQLEATLPQYAFDAPESGEAPDTEGGEASATEAPASEDGSGSGDGSGSADSGENAGSGEDAGTDADADADVGTESGSGRSGGHDEFERRVGGSFGWDDQGFGRLSATLAPDEAVLFETALRAAREAVFRDKCEVLGPGAARPQVSTVEALSEMARSFLATGITRHPGATRFRVFAHLEAGSGGNRMRSHLGPVLPDRIRRFLTCDSDVIPVWESHGTPISVGRSLRVVTDQMRKLIEHRDGGCAVPGCGRTTILDIHHIVHWEHGGATDTHNLVTLCRTHHRRHHLGILHITGNADTRDPGDPDALGFADRWGRPLTRAPEPKPPDTDEPTQAAQAADLPSDPYPAPTHERLRREDFYLPRTPPRAGPDHHAA